MPSVKKNLHKLMRNLSNPAIDHHHQPLPGHHKRQDILRRTLCTTTASQEDATLPVAASSKENGHAEDSEEESGNFIHKYLNGEIQRIHPAVYSDRTGDTLIVHFLAQLDDHLRLCCSGPDEGISRVAYLGSRRLYADIDEEDDNEEPGKEEKTQHLPAMMRAALFAKSGKQCYLPRQDFRSLVYGDSKKTNNVLTPLVESSERHSLLLNHQRRLSKSGSVVSMTHIGVAPRARIEELIEEDEENETSGSSSEVTSEMVQLDPPLPSSSTPELTISSHPVVINGHADKENLTEPVPPILLPQTQSSAATNTTPTTTNGPAVTPRPKNQHKFKSARARRSLHQQLLEDFPFSMETKLPWTTAGHDRAYGLSTTLYEMNPITSEVAGSPTADVFALTARENNAVLCIADGVNWGSAARLAAQCAVRGAIDCLNAQWKDLFLHNNNTRLRSTKDLFDVLLQAVHAAHNLILQEHGALSTLCIAVICPLQDAKRYVCACVNIGDSLAFVFNRKFGVREITKDSHNVNAMRDMRDAMGALGPVDGIRPELSNYTCSMTIVENDDLVFLTTDGISDNFDPVIGKFCVAEGDDSTAFKDLLGKANASAQRGDVNPAFEHQDKKGRFEENELGVSLSLPRVTAMQRHELTLLRMEDLIRHGITIGDKPCTNARQLCECFLNFAVQLTSAKRHILEDPDIYPAGDGQKQSKNAQRHQRRKACERLALLPGKLDHATIVAYQVGEWIDSPVQMGLTVGSSEEPISLNNDTTMEDHEDVDRKWRPNGIVNARVTLNNSSEASRDRRVSLAFPSIDSPDLSRRTSIQPDFSTLGYALPSDVGVIGDDDSHDTRL